MIHWKQSAFSLVELSIVLVILGLLTGGILAGQSLIRAAEIRSVSTELGKYQTAIYTFRDKYFALPGDMRNATDFWGSVTDSGDTCPNGAGSGTETCDGDGDGVIDNTTGVYYESVRAWQHLANAGLIEGDYSGTQNGSSPYITLGTNVPRSKITDAGYSIVSYGAGYGFGSGTGSGTDMCWDCTTQIYRMAIFFGGSGTDAMRYHSVLKPEEAWNIDTKMDDGKPDFGKITSGSVGGACFTSATTPSDYDLQETEKRCNLVLNLIR